MFYLILSWSDLVEQMIEQYDTQQHLHCPLCGEKYSLSDVTDAMRHVKSCYVERRVRNQLFNSRGLPSKTRMKQVLNTVDQIEQEINKYLTAFSAEHHLFLK